MIFEKNKLKGEDDITCYQLSLRDTLSKFKRGEITKESAYSIIRFFIHDAQSEAIKKDRMRRMGVGIHNKNKE